MTVLLKRPQNIRMVRADLQFLWSQALAFIGWVTERFRGKKGKHGHARGTNKAITAVEVWRGPGEAL